ncbi:MAG: YjgP/YjgQ family permease [Pleurocapsa sp. CRU_1_2]|nr:YjgP/YjgQ family permease [Pleurocapsa sp. CRU_1_2]
MKYSWQISLMDCYLVRQLSWAFFLSVSCLTTLGVAIGTVADLAFKINEYQLPIPIAILVFYYKIPEYAAYALPISILLTSLLIYGRLNSDRELTALFSFGISSYRIVLPAFLFSLLITGITFLLNELIVPAANYQANLLQSPYLAKTELNLQKQDIYYAEYASGADASKKLQRIYFAEQYDQPRLIRVTILGFKQAQVKQIITAQSAQWNQQQQTWDLSQGAIARFDDNLQINTAQEFTSKQLPLSGTIFQIVNQKRSPEDMNIRQAKAYVNLIKDSAEPTQIAQFTVLIQQKYAFPSICVVFASIGSAIGIKYFELNRARSFALCVAIVFAYYCLGFALGSLGITGVISPWLAAWLPNLIGVGLGGYLLIADAE